MGTMSDNEIHIGKFDSVKDILKPISRDISTPDFNKNKS